MANIASQKKRNRQNEKARVRNKAVRSELRTRTRAVHEAVAEGDAERATDEGRRAQKSVGVAARKGVLHKRTAARKQSRLAKAVNSAAS